MAKQADWLVKINARLPAYLETLKVPEEPGHFLPCTDGVTELGRQIALGFSCFAVKIFYTLGAWERLPAGQQTGWIDFIKSFQKKAHQEKGPIAQDAFVDRPVVEYLTSRISKHRQVLNRLFRRNRLSYPNQVIIAETKQAIATLAQVGERPSRPYQGFPVTPEGVRTYLQGHDWTKPWGAGGQASALVVFLKTQSSAFWDQWKTEELLNVCDHFFDKLADRQTGGYFIGTVPDHGQLINGAMKVLTALDWLGVPIHYPERLIDTCLGQLPSSEGCHLVDAVYVLYRCLKQTRYGKRKIQAYCTQILEMIKEHYNSDGGFSYGTGRSQTTYYGVPISRGLAESDIHGTCLLTWAVAMILEIFNDGTLGWQVIRP
jgi:hypothetical protein